MSEKLFAPLDEFKPRELEILKLMADGLSNQEIADQLFVTKETVRWYNKQIYSKLGTSRRTGAIALAREMGLIGEPPAPSPDNQNIHHTLPFTTGPFVGRDEELAQLSELLQRPDIRLLSIIASGGMGKSRLSLELGHLVKSNYQQGAVLIDLTPARHSDDIAKLAVASLKLSVRGNQTSEEVLCNYCREKELLLIFDNFEHVLSGAKLLADILEAAPKVSILATSRERLNLRVETAFRLQPVTQDAEQLFIEAATMMRPDSVFAEDDLPVIHRMVALVGGSPLALILAATWVDTLSIAEIAEEIEANLDFLNADMGDMPERQRSFHAVVDPTWKRLDEQEQKAYMWASLFRGGFTRESFGQVTGTSVRTLQTLINRSLVNHGHGRRYDMHPLLRQYAREKLEMTGTSAEARKAHLDTFLNYARCHANRMFAGQGYLESLEALEVEQDNFRAALDWSLPGNSVDQAVALILANGELWLTRSRAQEATTYIEAAIQQSEHPQLHYWRSAFLDRLGQIAQSIESAHYVIEYGQTNQDYEMLAAGQMRLALMQNSSAEARPLLESALSNALETANQNLIANCHSALALVCSVGDADPHMIEEANAHFQRALEIFESLGDLRGISRVTNNLAIKIRDIPERQQEAKELMEYSLQLKRKIGDLAGEARRLTTLSLWAIEAEEFEYAQERLARSREICEALGERDRLSYALTVEGLLYLLMMDYERAQARLEQSLQVHRAIKDYKGIIDIYGFLGQLYLLQKNLNDARLSILSGIEVGMKEHSSSAMLLIAYANYLWHKRDRKSLPIIATLAQQNLNTYSGSQAIVDNYFLQPLIYRVQQHVGDGAWQQALTQTADTTIEQAFEQIVQEIEIYGVSNDGRPDGISS